MKELYLHIGVQEGETSPVDTLLAIIGEEGEDISALLNGNAQLQAETKEEAPKATTETKTESTAVAIPEGVQVITMPRLSDTMD